MMKAVDKAIARETAKRHAEAKAAWLAQDRWDEYADMFLSADSGYFDGAE